MKRFFIFLLIVLLQPSVWGDFNSDARGTTAANFLKIGVGARAAAMGEAYSAVADDATALYWNPAALTRIERRSATLMHAAYLESTALEYAAYAHHNGHQGFGLGLQYFSAGRLQETDENNVPRGSFTPYDMAVSLGYAWEFVEKGWSIGGSGKYVQSKILTTAQTYAVDVGVLSPRFFGDKLDVSFVVYNLGGKMRFEEASDPLPLSYRLGSAWHFSSHWISSTDIVFPKDNQPFIAFGSEYVWKVLETLSVAGRAGYQSRADRDVDGLAGGSSGFGIIGQTLSFDYALLPFGSLGLTHRVSLSFKF